MPSYLRPMHAPGKGGRPGIRESRMRIELVPRHARVRERRVLALASCSSDFYGQVRARNRIRS
jgi:DNA repair photolyase